jgi:D-3-phosphoglycerate dehydrogenase
MSKIVAFNKMADPLTYENERLLSIPGVEIVKSPATTEEEMIKDAKDAEVILFTSAAFPKNVIEGLESCKVIQRYGIGYDTVDTAAAKEKGIFVCNSPNYGVVDVAEHAFSLIFACLKRLVKMNDRVRDNNWGFENMGKSNRLSGKTVGFLGFGKIARAVAGFTLPFGTKNLVYDPYVSADALAPFGAEAVSLERLFKESDIITVHLPLSDATRHTVGAAELSLMKPSAILVNTSRGPVIDEAALVDALVDGTIGGAGLDVFEDEEGGIDKRILSLDNVVLTPHVAWNTAEAVDAIHVEVTENIVKYLTEGRPDNIVNGL